MAIAGIEDEDMKVLLAEHFTPSQEITTTERLFGREQKLKDIDRALNSPGRSVFIYGDRGVGKSSLALTAANQRCEDGLPPIRVVCGKNETFGQILQAVGNAVTEVKGRMETQKQPSELSLNILGSGGSIKSGGSSTAVVPAPQSINEALDVIRYVLAKRHGQFVVIIDEMERLGLHAEREKFAELVKNIPNVDQRVKFIFCGIGANVTELVGEHPSAGRIMEPVELEKLHHNHLWEIIETVARQLEVEVEYEMLLRIGQLSDGFPSYVHLIGESLFWSVFDDNETINAVKLRHFNAGIKGALQRSEATLRLQYEQATRKTKNTLDYEEALWALADRNSDQRQLGEIYEVSYKRVMEARPNRSLLDQEKLNQRFHSLRKDNHGKIVQNFKAGWWGFRENIIRGYVRLKAAEQGIELGRDHAITNF